MSNKNDKTKIRIARCHLAYINTDLLYSAMRCKNIINPGIFIKEIIKSYYKTEIETEEDIKKLQSKVAEDNYDDIGEFLQEKMREIVDKNKDNKYITILDYLTNNKESLIKEKYISVEDIWGTYIQYVPILSNEDYEEMINEIRKHSDISIINARFVGKGYRKEEDRKVAVLYFIKDAKYYPQDYLLANTMLYKGIELTQDFLGKRNTY